VKDNGPFHDGADIDASVAGAVTLTNDADAKETRSVYARTQRHMHTPTHRRRHGKLTQSSPRHRLLLLLHYTHLMACFPGQPGQASTREVKPVWIRMMMGFGMQWHQLDHTQTICTSFQADNHTSTSWLSFLQAGCSSWCPTNSVKALKAEYRHRIDKYLDTLLANKTAQKALPPTTDKSCSRKMADCPSYY